MDFEFETLTTYKGVWLTIVVILKNETSRRRASSKRAKRRNDSGQIRRRQEDLCAEDAVFGNNRRPSEIHRQAKVRFVIDSGIFEVT